jgi:hypothetical protein
MAVTEVMGLAANAMDKGETDALLVICLSGSDENAIVGGEITVEAIDRMVLLLSDLKARAAAKGDTDTVLHVWR